MKCKACGTPVTDKNANFCPQCGSKLPKIKVIRKLNKSDNNNVADSPETGSVGFKLGKLLGKASNIVDEAKERTLSAKNTSEDEMLPFFEQTPEEQNQDDFENAALVNNKKRPVLKIAGGAFLAIVALFVVFSIAADRTAPEISTQSATIEYGNSLSVNRIGTAADDRDSNPKLTIIGVDPSNDADISSDGKSILFKKAGKFTVKLEASDSSSNKTTADAQVNVSDKIAPVFPKATDTETVSYGEEIDIPSAVNAAKATDEGSACKVAIKSIKPKSEGLSEADFEAKNNKVKFLKPGDYEIDLEATDEFNNIATTTIAITAVDKKKPELQGVPSTIEIASDKTKETADWRNGMSANDEVDGDLTSKITISDDAVKYGTVGTYAATIMVSDKAGNKCEQSTNIKIVKAATPIAAAGSAASSSSGGGTVYITNSGKKYHHAGCQYLKSSQIPISLNDAIARGYTACSRC